MLNSLLLSMQLNWWIGCLCIFVNNSTYDLMLHGVIFVVVKCVRERDQFHQWLANVILLVIDIVSYLDTYL